MDTKNIIQASPTKDLFIDILTRDIGLVDAIVDLVDNSIDGAKRMRPDEVYAGLSIDLWVGPDKFVLRDNCGGIPVDIARDYAFRFGRPRNAPLTAGSVGQFGVGMKRALFKMGESFSITSKTERSHFVVKVEVNDWRKNEDWHLSFAELDEAAIINPRDTGTTIEVNVLKEDVKESFSLQNFVADLRAELEAAQQTSLQRGISISVNDHKLSFLPSTLLTSEQLKPAYKKVEYFQNEEHPVFVRIYAGLGESDPDSAGWYIFCNGRQLLAADQSSKTGWGESGGMPKFHPQYARFRGYVYFDSVRAERLPWNTTKTDVEVDSSLYKGVKSEMISLALPVKSFLDRLKTEREQPGLTSDERVVEGLISTMQSRSLMQITDQGVFAIPELALKPTGPKLNRIAYSRDAEKVLIVMESIGARSPKEAGEKTFDYYFDMECSD